MVPAPEREPTNIWVVLAVMLSMALHCMILYVPFFRSIFSTAASNTDEWIAVLLISFPVIVLDEVLKMISRQIEGMLMLSLPLRL